MGRPKTACDIARVVAISLRSTCLQRDVVFLPVKKHMTAFGGGRESKQKKMNDTEKKRRIWTWRLCYADRKRFEQEKIAISQNEIEQEIIKIDPNPRLGMYIVMPVDSRAMICPQNVVVVTAEQRKKFMKLVHQNNIQEYNRIIMQLKLK